ncbi:uncharacterized protein LAESUDRAFT_306545 [Laetiporus sulphureus 93-53]|uniref:Uncharacterized protein n=1 Tax=Laetiporus sulphureus 93-53 TaxID=1314785 RepID=A0A165D964_9APHY|nr:uncharacterized protein LAESUDRAFT_306545 [Laetiporus sulphureus 93-53]KZT04365.1 hypothetical protein LAESUDRAFT_306545 [Laetiporus sulphureus 93-53]
MLVGPVSRFSSSCDRVREDKRRGGGLMVAARDSDYPCILVSVSLVCGPCSSCGQSPLRLVRGLVALLSLPSSSRAS